MPFSDPYLKGHLDIHKADRKLKARLAPCGRCSVLGSGFRSDQGLSLQHVCPTCDVSRYALRSYFFAPSGALSVFRDSIDSLNRA